jgi:hypothetical protein
MRKMRQQEPSTEWDHVGAAHFGQKTLAMSFDPRRWLTQSTGVSPDLTRSSCDVERSAAGQMRDEKGLARLPGAGQAF